jgi:hypothetical protein
MGASLKRARTTVNDRRVYAEFAAALGMFGYNPVESAKLTEDARRAAAALERAGSTEATQARAQARIQRIARRVEGYAEGLTITRKGYVLHLPCFEA